jgi:hypothetical protein
VPVQRQVLSHSLIVADAGRLDRVAGLTEAAVGAIIFGVAAEGVSELIQGRDPNKEMQGNPLGGAPARGRYRIPGGWPVSGRFPCSRDRDRLS